MKAKLADLKFDDKNANKGTERGAAAIEDSIQQYGFGRAILIDKNNRIIAGNKSAEQAGQLGLEDVEIIQTDGSKIIAVQRTDLDLKRDKKAKALAVADNRTGELSLDWDANVLAGLMGEGVDLSGLFSGDELAGLGVAVGETDLLGDEDDVPEKPAKTKTKPGDLYLMGNHRLLCGDSTSAECVAKLMAGALADCVWTDPPYNVAYTGKTKDALTIQNDQMDDATFRRFLLDAFTAMRASCRDGAAIYVAHADSEGYNFRGAMRDAGWLVKQCLIWVKNSMVMGRQDYHWQHEPILYGWKPGASHHWYSDRSQTTVLEFARPSRSEEHPTMKPVALVEYCIGNSCTAGGIVLDLFGGSGTTLLACEKSGRAAYLMELDPAYCDVIVTRWENATGKKAVLSGQNGRTKPTQPKRARRNGKEKA